MDFLIFILTVSGFLYNSNHSNSLIKQDKVMDL